MTVTSEELIEGHLAAVTPGRWSWGFNANSWDDGDSSVVAHKSGVICNIPSNVTALRHGNRARTREDQLANALWIAQSPAYVRFLLDRITGLESLLVAITKGDE